MSLKRITPEHILFTAALLLGLVLRFANLGSASLSDSEASWALQALELARSRNLATLDIGPQPAYVILTSWLFSFFGSSNFLARFWPALAGSLLVLIPISILYRRSETPPDGSQGALLVSGRMAAILMAFGLALTPGLVVVSRQAGGPMMALSFGLLAISCYFLRWPLLAGSFAALALLSGPAVVNGLVILGVIWITGLLLERRVKITESTPAGISLAAWRIGNDGRFEWRTFTAALILTLLLVATSFFRFPAGLAAWFETLPAYLAGWTTNSGVPIFQMSAALLVYQPIILIFGLVGALRGLISPFFKSETGQARPKAGIILSLTWIITGLFITLVYPARQTADLVWVIVPLTALAAWEIEHYLPRSRPHPVSIVQSLLLITLMGLFWYSLATLGRAQTLESERLVRYAVMFFILALGALITVLIQLGWSWETARNGLTWGILGGLFLLSISMLWGAAYLRPNQPQELWGPSPAPGEASLVLATLQDLSYHNRGRPETIDILSEVSNPSLRWLLREFKNVRYVDQLSNITGSRANLLSDQELPSILITNPAQEAPALIVSYRGQDFPWRISPGWSGALPGDLASWLTFRQAPLLQEKIILWARSDRFPGGELELPSSSIEPQPAGEVPNPLDEPDEILEDMQSQP